MTRFSIALVALGLMAAIAFFPQHWLPFVLISSVAGILIILAGLFRRVTGS